MGQLLVYAQHSICRFGNKEGLKPLPSYKQVLDKQHSHNLPDSENQILCPFAHQVTFWEGFQSWR